MKRIRLYAEDFDTELWYDYCDLCSVPHDSECIIIYFEKAEGEQYE